MMGKSGVTECAHVELGAVTYATRWVVAVQGKGEL